MRLLRPLRASLLLLSLPAALLASGCADDSADAPPADGAAGSTSGAGGAAGARSHTPTPPGADVPSGGSGGGDAGVDPCGGCDSLSDPCNRGACDAGTKSCVKVPVGDGELCDDGDACTTADACTAGACQGKPVVCDNLADSCNSAACDPKTGACVKTAKADGTACDDGTVCTTNDACKGGGCTGTPLECTGGDACNAAVCDPKKGCTTAPLTGPACDDGDGCTGSDHCDSGTCKGVTLDCSALEGPCAAAACNPTTGACDVVTKADGAACDDGNGCTSSDQCKGGVCGGAPVVCKGGDVCNAPVCDPATGACSVVPLDGPACDDGDACTASDHCASGACKGAPVVCAAVDACNDAACDPASGACKPVPAKDGKPCDTDPTDCSAQACAAGKCVGKPVADCTACGAKGGEVCLGGVCGPEQPGERLDFESGGAPASWTSGATKPWTVTTQLAQQGTSSLRSAAVGDGQASTLSRAVFLGTSARVQFWFKVSSDGKDALTFSIDGKTQKSWSGNLPWGWVDAPVSAGEHVISWTYAKDASGSSGLDAAFLDQVSISSELSAEGFEGAALPAAFTTDGASPWTVTTSDAHGGARSVRSGAITSSQQTSLHRHFSLAGTSVVGWFYRMSTDADDYWRVFVDGKLQTELNGQTPGWYLDTALLAPGEHDVEWRYAKGPSGSDPIDAVFIDDMFVEPLSCP